MRACGIIAEYNPFHNGHLYQLQEARKRTQADVVIVVMSGNFLQRGEPAVVDKWTRAKMALDHGADIVIELPVSFSVQAADYFAKGAVEILATLGCQVISFGSESGSSQEFKNAGEVFVEKKREIDQAFTKLEEQGLTYVKRMQQAILQVVPNFPLDLSQPNNQLGFAYSKEIAQSGYAIEIEAIPRKGVGYLEKNIQKHENIASATAIRTSLFETEDRKKTENYMPSNAYQLLEQTQWTNWDNYWPLLEYQLTTSSINQLQDIYQMEEGIEFRLKEAVQAASNMNDFLNQIKNKRVTWTRIQRLCLYVLFQMKKEEMMEELKRVKALHLLGFSSQGQKYISEKKSDLSIPLLANINQGNAHLWKQDIRVNEIYRLANKQKIMKQDFTRKPLKSVDIKKLH